MTTLQKNLNMPKIALGAWAWGAGAAGGDQVFGNSFDESDFEPVFKAALNRGLNLWDTAAVYGMGASEQILGNLSKNENRSALLFSTKFTPQIAEKTSDAVKQMLSGSLERLQTSYVDIYWIHNPANVDKWTPQLVSLVESGKVKYIGVSNHNLAEIKQAQAILNKHNLKISAVQNHLSLLNRSSENSGIIDYCKENDITFFSYMVLEQGALSGKYTTKTPFPEHSERAKIYNDKLEPLEELIITIQGIASVHDSTVPEIAAAWAISKGTVPIIGVTKVNHVDDAFKAGQILLTETEIRTLEEAADNSGIRIVREWEKEMN